MVEPPPGAPPFKGRISAYREFIDTLRYASERFKNEGDGGHGGAKLACAAVIRFLGVRYENPELAAPFLALREAITDLQEGVHPELLSRSKDERKRSRSRQRKHAQMFASACMEALMQLGDDQEAAARRVARYSAKWPSFKGAEVDHTTVRNWRDKIRASRGPLLRQFDLICSDFVTHSDRRYVDNWLRKGPPGVPSSDDSDPSAEPAVD